MGHIYFGEDAEMECDGAAAAQAAGPLAAAGVGGAAPPGWRTQPAQQPLRCGACCSRARVSFNDADPTYVFKAARSPDCTTVAASLSNNAIKWYSLANAQLAHGGSFSKAHTNTITDVQFPVAAAPHALYSCSRDGALKGWDLRSKAPAESYQAPKGEQLFCFSMSDDLIAAGGQSKVLFWDRRKHSQLEAFGDVHSDDVTQVLFHQPSRKLLTASEDGVVALHDVAAGPREYDGFVGALSIGHSVQQLGLYGPEGGTLWCRTGTETLQLWDWLAAADESVPGGDAAVADLTDARGMAVAAACAAQAAARAAGDAAGAAGAAALEDVDYLVGCHWDAASQQLLLVAGNIDGTLGLFPVCEQQQRAGQLAPGANMLAPPAVVLQGCHRDIVRSVDCFDGAAAQQLLCVTAGEDALLGLWTLDAATAAAAAAGSSSRDSGGDSAGPQRQHAAAAGGGSGSMRRSPY